MIKEENEEEEEEEEGSETRRREEGELEGQQIELEVESDLLSKKRRTWSKTTCSLGAATATGAMSALQKQGKEVGERGREELVQKVVVFFSHRINF